MTLFESEVPRFFFDEPVLILAMHAEQVHYFYASHMALMPDNRMIPMADDGAHALGAHAVLDTGCTIDPEFFGEWSQEDADKVHTVIAHLKQFIDLKTEGHA